MNPARVAIVGGVAALVGAGAAALSGRQEPTVAPPAAQSLWSCPGTPRNPARPGRKPPACWSRKGTAIIQQNDTGLAQAAADPATPVAVRHFALAVPLNDPLLLGDAPVTVTLAYALTDRTGWADARIDVQPYAMGRPGDGAIVAQPGGERRHTGIVGARDGGDAMHFMLSPDMVRAQGGVTLNVTLRVRTLNGGAATLVLRSITLAGGLG